MHPATPPLQPFLKHNLRDEGFPVGDAFTALELRILPVAGSGWDPRLSGQGPPWGKGWGLARGHATGSRLPTLCAPALLPCACEPGGRPLPPGTGHSCWRVCGPTLPPVLVLQLLGPTLLDERLSWFLALPTDPHPPIWLSMSWFLLCSN